MFSAASDQKRTRMHKPRIARRRSALLCMALAMSLLSRTYDMFVLLYIVVHLIEFWVILPWIIMDHFLCTDGWIFTIPDTFVELCLIIFA